MFLTVGARPGADDGHDGESLLPACAEVRPTELLRVPSPDEPDAGRCARPKKPLCARGPGGPELHADVSIAAHDRKGLERLCRYLARPPIPQDRLERRGDGKLVLSLKRTWKGGVKAVVFEPHALIARLAAAGAAPGSALLGVLAALVDAIAGRDEVEQQVRTKVVATANGAAEALAE